MGVAIAVVLIGTQTASGASGDALIPPVPPSDQSKGIFVSDQGVFLEGKNTVSKAKTTIRIPLTLLHAYTTVNFLPPNPEFDEVAAGYVLSPKGETQRYGLFAPIRTTVLAFGALPVKATVQLSQPELASGFLDPLIIATKSNLATGYISPTSVTGKLSLTISDVTVDGVPLDVGPNCGTAQPLPVHLTGISPAYNIGAGGPLTGNVSIGAFANCGAGGQDLDPLLDGMLSSKSNPLTMSQGGLGVWVPPESCPLLDPETAPSGCTLPLPVK